MKEKLTNNILLKILSLLIAFFVWLIVVNADNPIMTESFVISDVQLLNEAYIDADGKMCMQDEEQEPIRVTIRAERKILDGISVSDIRAVADLQQAVSLDTDPVMVPITAFCDGISPDNIEVTPQNLSLHVEDKDTQEFVVNVTTDNTRPDREYEVGTLTSNPEKLKITGPISLINKIDRVNAAIDVTDASEDVTQETEVTVIDKNGEPFSDADMIDTDYFYMILTYGNRHGGAAELAEQLCRECGVRVDYINVLLMVDNWLPSFDMDEQRRIDKNVQGQLDAILSDLKERREMISPVTDTDRAAHRQFLDRMSQMPPDAWQHLLRVTDSCIGCGICEQVCPSASIHLEQGRAVFTPGNCQTC